MRRVVTRPVTFNFNKDVSSRWLPDHPELRNCAVADLKKRWQTVVHDLSRASIGAREMLDIIVREHLSRAAVAVGPEADDPESVVALPQHYHDLPLKFLVRCAFDFFVKPDGGKPKLAEDSDKKQQHAERHPLVLGVWQSVFSQWSNAHVIAETASSRWAMGGLHHAVQGYATAIAHEVVQLTSETRTMLQRSGSLLRTFLVREPSVVGHWSIAEVEKLMSSPEVQDEALKKRRAALAERNPSAAAKLSTLLGLYHRSCCYKPGDNVGADDDDDDDDDDDGDSDDLDPDVDIDADADDELDGVNSSSSKASAAGDWCALRLRWVMQTWRRKTKARPLVPSSQIGPRFVTLDKQSMHRLVTKWQEDVCRRVAQHNKALEVAAPAPPDSESDTAASAGPSGSGSGVAPARLEVALPSPVCDAADFRVTHLFDSQAGSVMHGILRSLLGVKSTDGGDSEHASDWQPWDDSALVPIVQSLKTDGYSLRLSVSVPQLYPRMCWPVDVRSSTGRGSTTTRSSAAAGGGTATASTSTSAAVPSIPYNVTARKANVHLRTVPPANRQRGHCKGLCANPSFVDFVTQTRGLFSFDALWSGTPGELASGSLPWCPEAEGAVIHYFDGGIVSVLASKHGSLLGASMPRGRGRRVAKTAKEAATLFPLPAAAAAGSTEWTATMRQRRRVTSVRYGNVPAAVFSVQDAFSKATRKAGSVPAALQHTVTFLQVRVRVCAVFAWVPPSSSVCVWYVHVLLPICCCVRVLSLLPMAVTATASGCPVRVQRLAQGAERQVCEAAAAAAVLRQPAWAAGHQRVKERRGGHRRELPGLKRTSQRRRFWQQRPEGTCCCCCVQVFARRV
jgi:hypothetical protein